jgi:hypothetical protein
MDNIFKILIELSFLAFLGLIYYLFQRKKITSAHYQQKEILKDLQEIKSSLNQHIQQQTHPIENLLNLLQQIEEAQNITEPSELVAYIESIDITDLPENIQKMWLEFFSK